jgi:hypothetical protein
MTELMTELEDQKFQEDRKPKNFGFKVFVICNPSSINAEEILEQREEILGHRNSKEKDQIVNQHHKEITM